MDRTTRRVSRRWFGIGGSLALAWLCVRVAWIHPGAGSDATCESADPVELERRGDPPAPALAPPFQSDARTVEAVAQVDERRPDAPELQFAGASALSLRVLDRRADRKGELAFVVETDAADGTFAWSFPIVAGRRSRIPNLPPFAPLKLRVQRGGAPAYSHPELLILAPGETRDLDLAIGAGTELTVHVVDDQDRPVSGRRLGLLQHGVDAKAGEDHSVLLPGSDPAYEAAKETDARGTCVFPGVSAGAWWVALAPTRRPWDALDADALTPVAQRVELVEEDTAREITLRTWRGLYIRGRVEVPDDRLFPPGATTNDSPGVILIAHRSQRAGGLTGQPELDGSFALGPVTDDEHVIETFSARYAPILPIRARARDGPIVVRLQLGARIQGRVIDAAGGAGVRSEVVLTRVDAPGPEGLGSSDDRGTFGFAGLAAGEYVVSAFAGDGRTGASLRRRVALTDAPADVDVELVPLGASGLVRVVLEGAVAPGRVTLWSDGVCRAYAFFDGPRVALFGAPEGDLEARLLIDDECVERKTLRVERGATAEVRFRR